MFKRGQLIQSQFKFLKSWLCECSPWYRVTLRILKMSLRSLVLDWRVMPINSQYLASTSSLGYQYQADLVEEIARILTTWKLPRHFQKQERRWIGWNTKHFAVRFVAAPLKVLDWLKLSHMLWHMKKPLVLRHQKWWLSWCNDCWPFSSPSGDMVFWHTWPVAYNVNRKRIVTFIFTKSVGLWTKR